MKMVIAYVQPHMEHKVLETLHGLPSLSGATFDHVRGFGRGRAGRSQREGGEWFATTRPKVRVEAVVSDELASELVAAIQKSAHTGSRGDGKVFVLDVVRAVRISSGEEGATAV